MRVVDSVGAGVDGATVTADLDRDGGVLDSGMTESTDSSGEATFEYSVKKQALPAGTYTLSVTDVSASGMTWDDTPPVTDSWTK